MVMNERDERASMEDISILAKQARAFYVAILGQKFSPQAALDLTRAWLQSTVIRRTESHGPPSEPEQ